jgi:hypothetical protein
VREEGPNIFALPECAGQPWRVQRADRPCWYTFQALLVRTLPMKLLAPGRVEEYPPEVGDQSG